MLWEKNGSILYSILFSVPYTEIFFVFLKKKIELYLIVFDIIHLLVAFFKRDSALSNISISGIILRHTHTHHTTPLASYNLCHCCTTKIMNPTCVNSTFSVPFICLLWFTSNIGKGWRERRGDEHQFEFYSRRYFILIIFYRSELALSLIFFT